MKAKIYLDCFYFQWAFVFANMKTTALADGQTDAKCLHRVFSRACLLTNNNKHNNTVVLSHSMQATTAPFKY
jgi:hypothetical protein